MRADRNSQPLRGITAGPDEISSRMNDYRTLVSRIATLERFRSIMDRSGDPIFIYDLESGRILDTSGAAGQWSGYHRIVLTGMNIADLIDEDARKAIGELTGEHRHRDDIPATIRGRDGTRVPCTISASTARLDGKPIAVVIAREAAKAPVSPVPVEVKESAATTGATAADGNKLTEDQLRAALQEKEVMLKEIHHRVKNNLQVISSLLSIQARYLTDPHDVKLFQESQDRIRTMALVHEKLYQSSDLETVDFGPYIERLVTNLFRSYSGGRSVVNLRVDVKDVRLNVDRAMPCGLIVNELVTNALKYAFPDGRNGTITVAMRRAGDDYVLEVADDGVGMPAGFDLSQSESLGLQLVRTLTDQLDGTIAVDPAGGTKYTIMFKV